MTIITWIQNFLYFLDTAVVPLIIALAALFFLWNAARFFIFQSASEEGRTKAKRLMLWGIGALVLIISTWAIVNILVGTLGFRNDQSLTPDYLGRSGYNGGNPNANTYACTDLAFGLQWCGRNSTDVQYFPGSDTVIDPNPPPKTTTVTFP